MRAGPPSDWLEAGGTTYQQGLPLCTTADSSGQEGGTQADFCLPASTLIRSLGVPMCPVSGSQGGTHWAWPELRRYSWSK